MELKLYLLFLLIGAIIGLSHLSENNMARMKRQLVHGRWRTIVPLRRKT